MATPPVGYSHLIDVEPGRAVVMQTRPAQSSQRAVRPPGGAPCAVIDLAERLRTDDADRLAEHAAGNGQHRPPDRLPAPLRPLSAGAVQLLEVAAVFDAPFSVEDVAEVLGEPVGRILPALREALAAAVVVPRADLIAYGSQQVRQAVAARIPQPIRLALHRQVGTVLLARGESAVRAVPHLVESVRSGDR